MTTATLYVIQNILKKRLKPEKEALLYLFAIFLANSYAPEPNPGPRAPKYPCGTCSKAVTWKTAGVCCDSCEKWYHKNCLGMDTHIYKDRPSTYQSSKVLPDTNITANKSNTKSVKKGYSKPPKYPCGSCNGAVTWKTAAVCCDSCEKWYHKECIGMSTLVYQGLNNAQWECDQCGLPNFSTCLFDTSIVMNTNTSHFDSSTNSSFCVGNIGSPSAASSPIQKTSKQPYNQTRNKRSDLPLRIIVVNCQSIRNKKADIDNLIETTKPDIMIGNESWLHKDISSTEVFPQGYIAYRKDRKTDAHGGVFILISDKYLSSEPPDLKSDDISEQLWVKVQITGSSDLYIDG
ncbi:Hypothetical predicted protein [Mytilus galloprovincialis]|uniref:PHD-type domain-containing protein n=1 Tax=Mytilus galloprovincialis TaxID=29158 RepID=A0A8B6ECF6_MYTGA|nr:Hypothetical predicted protein [Mytilus galloprovincialis]